MIAGCSKLMSVFALPAPNHRGASLLCLHPPTPEALRRFVPQAAAVTETRTAPGEKRGPGFRSRSNRRVGRVKNIRLGWAGENNDFFNSLIGWKG